MNFLSFILVEYAHATIPSLLLNNFPRVHSKISDFQFNGTAISFNVSGENKTTGFCRICIPKALMNDTYKVFVNGTEVEYDILSCSNATHSYLYFAYNHSTQKVTLIPEFPSSLTLPLLMTVTLLAVTVYTRKTMRARMRNHIHIVKSY